MPKILSKVRIDEYSKELKVRMAAFISQLKVDTASITKIISLYPAMVYRLWQRNWLSSPTVEQA
ncbi:hypothetical protein ACJJI4_03255 [Microbulbifer sp. TRSA002]|uniref:hypothetical protein n=1 Tax=Microbulbifer sp. TRSA002 TaxID=3243382 RepID=UPI00403A3531